jgi:uncharacterized membrane protein
MDQKIDKSPCLTRDLDVSCLFLGFFAVETLDRFTFSFWLMIRSLFFVFVRVLFGCFPLFLLNEKKRVAVLLVQSAL